jgi:DsbC/DsbD-like thiol-disulfide interchange protein
MPAGSVFVLLALLGMVAVVVVALVVRETIAVVVITISPALLYCVCVCVCVCLRLSHALVVAQRSYEEDKTKKAHALAPQNPLFLIFFFENSQK